MTESFLKFRQRAKRAALIKSAVFALFAGLFCSSALAVCLKLSAVYPKLWILIAAGVGSAAVAFIAAMFAMRIDDADLAKKIDRELDLEQKAQTMVEFSENDSDMLTLQREDTENKLSAYPVSSIRYGSVLKNMITPLLAAVMLVTAILVPLRASASEADPAFKFTAWQQARLKELISDVKNSAMAEEPKDTIVGELEVLTETLYEVERESRMKAEVTATILKVREINKLANTYSPIGRALSASDNELLAQLGYSIYLLSATEAEQALIDMQSGVSSENFGNMLSVYGNGIRLALNGLEISDSDALFAALSRFADSILSLSDFNLVPSLFSRAIADIRAALLTQHTNRTMSDYVEDELIYIFGLSADELPKDDEEEREESGGSEEAGEGGESGDDEELNTGGFGTGEVIYGSDDLVYSPEDNGFVVYGTVLDNYFKKFTDWVIDNEVPEELEKLVNDYFTSLYGGIQEEK